MPVFYICKTLVFAYGGFRSRFLGGKLTVGTLITESCLLLIKTNLRGNIYSLGGFCMIKVDIGMLNFQLVS